jgi:hypothetical protein
LERNTAGIGKNEQEKEEKRFRNKIKKLAKGLR